MPTYDYTCSACGKAIEVFHSMSDNPRKKCPSCGKLKLVRQIGMGGGVIFKGSGFYETDYRSESYTKAAEKDKAPKAEPKPKSTDSKSKTSKSKKD